MRNSTAYCLLVAAVASALCACGGGTHSTAAAVPPIGSGFNGVVSSGPPTDVLTYHNDTLRTGQNLTETALTPATVNSNKFGLLRVLSGDGVVDAAPLVVTKLSIAGAMRTVVYFATESDSVYAYDADTFQLLAKVSLLGAGETPATNTACSQVAPTIGVTATPVIDRTAGPNGTLYLVAMTMDASGTPTHRLHALDLVSLSDRMPPTTIQATYPGSSPFADSGVLTLNPKSYKERGALLLNQGMIYTVWASNCDQGEYNSWIVAYNETSLAQAQVLNLTPNGGAGAIWSVAGLAADSNGTIFGSIGNGTFDTNQDYGNTAIRFTVQSGSLAVADFFTPYNTVTQSNEDMDLGTGSNLLLPDQNDASGNTRQLMLVGGKPGDVYLLDRNNMGRFNSASNQVYQELPGFLPGGWYSTPAYYNGSLYLAGNSGALYSMTLNNAMLPSGPSSQSATAYAYPGTSPAVSANGGSNGIVWAVESAQNNPAVLHAYNPANLALEYYNSNQAANSRDAFGKGNKFITPVIANGKVFVGTPNGVAEFGILQ